MFRAKIDEIMRCWRRLYNDELLSMCSFPNVIRMIKTKATRWYAAHMEKKRKTCRVVMGKQIETLGVQK